MKQDNIELKESVFFRKGCTGMSGRKYRVKYTDSTDNIPLRTEDLKYYELMEYLDDPIITIKNIFIVDYEEKYSLTSLKEIKQAYKDNMNESSIRAQKGSIRSLKEKLKNEEKKLKEMETPIQKTLDS